jgi:hypothetical protein
MTRFLSERATCPAWLYEDGLAANVIAVDAVPMFAQHHALGQLIESGERL